MDEDNDSFVLAAFGLIAGSLNHFKIADVINETLGHKTAHNSGLDYGRNNGLSNDPTVDRCSPSWAMGVE